MSNPENANAVPPPEYVAATNIKELRKGGIAFSLSGERTRIVRSPVTGSDESSSKRVRDGPTSTRGWHPAIDQEGRPFGRRTLNRQVRRTERSSGAAGTRPGRGHADRRTVEVWSK
ncbi:hypothetical protein Misp05_07660 [Micromonospora sp. NBRC 107095]|nr:hypothetical protein Misp05_07660 [Micromonospora sp. NBRC 107095]